MKKNDIPDISPKEKPIAPYGHNDAGQPIRVPYKERSFWDRNKVNFMAYGALASIVAVTAAVSLAVVMPIKHQYRKHQYKQDGFQVSKLDKNIYLKALSPSEITMCFVNDDIDEYKRFDFDRQTVDNHHISYVGGAKGMPAQEVQTDSFVSFKDYGAGLYKDPDFSKEELKEQMQIAKIFHDKNLPKVR
jgi:hypothetical protein